MTKTLAEMMSNFTPQEQAEIQGEADHLIAEEMILRELRKAYNLTQTEIAKNLVLEEDNISKLEKETDLLLSTLANYIERLGGTLKLVAEFPEKQTIIIKSLTDLNND
ncbi:MAG: XRE family transcriptional regulator [Crocosphaera sp.]|nr:XRE family transcriptional regulator [Crocosphaera sp.]